MTSIQVNQLRKELSDFGSKVGYSSERICVERNHKPLFALVPIDDLRLLEYLEDRMDIEAAKDALKKGKFIEFDSLRKELGL